jgi:hypothetical protein
VLDLCSLAWESGLFSSTLVQALHFSSSISALYTVFVFQQLEVLVLSLTVFPVRGIIFTYNVPW